MDENVSDDGDGRVVAGGEVGIIELGVVIADGFAGAVAEEGLVSDIIKSVGVLGRKLESEGRRRRGGGIRLG